MEAVPRLHMLWFALKSSPEGTSFAKLKKYIAEFYQEDPETYSKDVFALETLRNQAMHPSKDANGCKVMKRYYCQLQSLLNRFPQLQERAGIFTFTWKDLYQSNICEVTDMRFEMAAVLFNIAASHTQVGASVTRGDIDGMKVACTHFQCAAWAFGELRERYASVNSGSDFMTPELLIFMQQVSFAQAQECILEKSLIDNRKPNIVAKVTAQIVVYYGAALAALLTGGNDGPVAQVIEGSVYKLWKKYVRFKISYLNCILYLYQGQQAEEQQKMGERVALYQAAWEKLEEARKESKGLPDQKEIMESLVFTADVVEAKRKNAKNENEFIYHESVPELADISAVQGANLVNGISFSVTDPEVAGDDIFARLVPMQAHEASSMYSEEKAKLLRKYGTQIEEKDAELATHMSSLSLDNLNINEEKANKIPQGIVDRCAALNAKKSAIPDLIASMSQLADICSEVEMNLQEIENILADEERQEREFEASTGVKRTPNPHITELTREFQKYKEAHTRAGESNDTLRKAMELHVNNLKILARPLQDIQQSTPKLSTELNTADVFRDVKLILNKVNEMKAQRSQFHADLRIAVNADDITEKVIAHGSQEGLQMLFERELSKHERLTQLIDQNLLAQQNILQALTESYAKAAPILKTLAELKHKRDNFFSSLAASYDVYEDLLGKSAKGLEFYKKLAGNVQKLLSRLKSARDVQSEERQQRMLNVSKASPAVASKDPVTTASSAPKLRDFLKSKNDNTAAGSMAGSTFIPTVRPNPLGSENPTQATCTSSYYSTPGTATAPPSGASTAPNEPPPPYSLQQPQFCDPNAGCYTNPIYQQQQQQAPPAYSMQASPNSQFTNLSADMSNMSLQQQQQPNYSNFPPAQVAYNSLGNQQTQSFVSVANAPPQNIFYPAAAATYPVQNYTPAPNSSMISSVNQLAATQTCTQPAMSMGSASVAAPSPAAQYAQNMYDPIVAAAAFQQQQQHLLNTSQVTATIPVISQQEQQQAAFQLQYSMQQQQQQLQNVVPIATAATNPGSQSLYVTTTSAVVQLPAPLQQAFVANSAPISLPPSNVAPTTSVDKPAYPVFSPYNTSTKHPGYTYNPLTGGYDYDSGYHEAAPINSQFYGRYTSPSVTQLAQQGRSNSHTTDSENATKLNLSTGLNNTIISHTQAAAAADSAPASKNDVRYYNPPYGIQSHGIALPVPYYSNYSLYDAMQPQLPAASYPAPPQKEPSYGQQLEQHSIYMQSGRSQPVTQTTKSVQYTQSPKSSPAGSAVSASTSPPPVQPAAATNQAKKSSNVDLLTDIDFSGVGVSAPPPMLPAPALKPEVVANPPINQAEVADAGAATKKVAEKLKQDTTTDTEAATCPPQDSGPLPTLSSIPLQLSSPADSAAVLKSSVSDLSSLDNNFNWDSVSVHNQPLAAAHNAALDIHSSFSLRPIDPFADDETLKYFHKEVERFEKIIESLNVKMLNGSTPLQTKWKELQDLLAKDGIKRTTTIARLFPEKNRSLDCLPYDHARVTLDKITDNYINAAFVKNFGPGCPNLIIAQTPQQNTVHDFWSMVWLQKARTVVCLHTPNEIFDPFWPHTLETELHFDDFSIKAVKVESLSHCSEFYLRLSMHGADEMLELSLLQIKGWTKSSASQVIGIAQNVLQAHQQRCLEFNTPASPLIMNCLTGSERSELTAIALCAVLATQTKRPVLINVVDVWYRICAQRQNAQRDTQTLEQAMQIVLTHAHDVLNKRGIMTSYQMKIAPQVASKEKEEAKDPLNELDPLWKLKQK